MASSISHSKARVPKLCCGLALAALLAWATCAFYTLRLNPENRFLKVAAQMKQTWARKMTAEHGAKYVIVGTSSCTFSVDGERMLARHQLPLVNMGLFASLEAKPLIEWALTEIKPGDSLVIAIEPQILSGPILPGAHAEQFCYLMGSPSWIKGVLEPVAPAGPASLLSLRPGGRHAALLTGKLLTRRPLFRYAIEDIHPSGWVETLATGDITGAAGVDAETAPGGRITGGRILLRSLAEWCRTNQVRVCLSLPVAYCPPALVPAFQRANAAYLLEVSQFLPVLEDRRLGANTNASLFADTGWHFNAEGVARRTDELAEPLRAWRLWNPDELRAIATGVASNSVAR